MRYIQYAISQESGLVFSRVGSEAAIPVLEYDLIGQNGNFNAPLTYKLERHSVYALSAEWGYLVWTKKIPTAIKNIHRAFWGLGPLTADDEPYELPRGIKGLATENWDVKLA